MSSSSPSKSPRSSYISGSLLEWILYGADSHSYYADSSLHHLHWYDLNLHLCWLSSLQPVRKYRLILCGIFNLNQLIFLFFLVLPSFQYGHRGKLFCMSLGLPSFISMLSTADSFCMCISIAVLTHHLFLRWQLALTGKVTRLLAFIAKQFTWRSVSFKSFTLFSWRSAKCP